MVLDNARSWIVDFHVDGLRLDAAHAIIDRSPRHILAELADQVRMPAAGDRQVVLIAESADNNVRYLLPTDRGGLGMDAVYADDFHHALRSYLLGEHEGYYADYQGTLEEVARVIAQGWLYEGQPSRHWGNQPRGTPARDRPASQFLYTIQNHDQVGNRAFGDRLHHVLDLDRYRAVSALLLVLPYTPLLFMGQEFAASSPFQYFTDHPPELGRLVTEGRRKEFGAFSAFADPKVQATIPDPQQESTYLRSKLRLEETEVEPGASLARLYAALLHLRVTDPVLRVADREQFDARTLGPDVLLVRRGLGDQVRLFAANYGDHPTSLPLSEGGWRVLLHTDAAEFGGSGSAVTIDGTAVRVPARTAVVLARPSP
jgi:maltooligosyltrehalose trehalohydrolase